MNPVLMNPEFRQNVRDVLTAVLPGWRISGMPAFKGWSWWCSKEDEAVEIRFRHNKMSIGVFNRPKDMLSTSPWDDIHKHNWRWESFEPTDFDGWFDALAREADASIRRMERARRLRLLGAAVPFVFIIIMGVLTAMITISMVRG